MCLNISATLSVCRKSSWSEQRTLPKPSTAFPGTTTRSRPWATPPPTAWWESTLSADSWPSTSQRLRKVRRSTAGYSTGTWGEVQSTMVVWTRKWTNNLQLQPSPSFRASDLCQLRVLVFVLLVLTLQDPQTTCESHDGTTPVLYRIIKTLSSISSRL